VAPPAPKRGIITTSRATWIRKRVRTGTGTSDFVEWTYRYDQCNRLIEELAPAVNGARARVQRAYDAAGRVTAVQDARGKTTEMTYDGLGRPRLVISPEVKNVEGALVRPITETRYDANGNVLESDRCRRPRNE
jgi:YD repeat-containing protein